MQLPAAFETALEAEFWCLARDFACEIIAEWKTWLTGSGPMVGIGVLSLADPESVKLPPWSWAMLVFVAGLVAAMFRVYRSLRRRHDALQNQLTGTGMAGPFLLVPLELKQERTNDV